MVVVRKMEVDNCNCEFVPKEKLECRLRSVDISILDYETKPTLGHELCQRLSGQFFEDVHHRKKAISLLRNSTESPISDEHSKQTTLPDVVLSCSNDEKSPKLTPENCGRVLGHIADNFEIDRRKRTFTTNQKRYLQRNEECLNEYKKCSFEHGFCERSEVTRNNIKINDERFDSLPNAEMTNTSEERNSSLGIEILFKNLLQRVLEEILFCK